MKGPALQANWVLNTQVSELIVDNNGLYEKTFI